MTDPEIPDEVLSLLSDHFNGLDEVEVLLLVRSEAPARCDRGRIASQLRLPDSELDASLEHLVKVSLLKREADGAYAYRAEDAAVRERVDALADIYARRPTVVMRVLNRLAVDRVRSRAARAFANAFVIGKHRKDGDG